MESTNKRFMQIRKLGTQTRYFQDLYHDLLTTSWLKFFFSFVIFFIFFNGFFAFLYWLSPIPVKGTDGSFFECFAFSVQTFSTVGYGAFSPATTVLHLITIAQSVLSVFVTAMLTGLIYAKFAKPNARIIFSDKVLIHTFDGKRTLSLRLGNLRSNQIAEAQIKLIALTTQKTAEGQSIRRQKDLRLVREHSLFFALSWTVMHIIDEASPVFGLTAENFKDQDIELAVSVIGYDSSFNQTVHSSAIYESDDIVFDRYFEDIVEYKDDNVHAIHYEKFNDLKS